MTLRSSLAPVLVLLMAPSIVGCANDDDKTSASTTNDSSSAWAVGEDATMVRVNPAGDVLFYPLETEGDLLAIACKGSDMAVAVGEDGVVLRTDDGGAAWQQVDVGTGALLRAVALSGGTAAYVAGSDIVLRSDDEGRSFSPVADAEGEWTAVATTAAGSLAWLTTAGGEIWRLEGDALTRSFTAVDALSGIAVTPDGAHLVAVGDHGAVLRSDDGGASWTSGLTHPTNIRDLHAVRIARDGSVIVAVGSAGVVVRVEGQAATVEELLDPGLSLRALHLSLDGHGHAVGDHGVAFSTHDAGLHWEPLELGLEQALFGLDDLHGEPHL